MVALIKPSEIPHHSFKQHTLAGVMLQSICLTFLERETLNCDQVIFSLSMSETVIQPYLDVARDAVHHVDECGAAYGAKRF
jgi:hypothetical protein